MPDNEPQAAQEGSPRPRPDKEALLSRAAFYGLFLRQEGYAADEAAALVMRRYPQTRPFVERLTRRKAVDPLDGPPKVLAR